MEVLASARYGVVSCSGKELLKYFLEKGNERISSHLCRHANGTIGDRQ